MLIGASAASYPGELRLWFAVGAICASLGWFAGPSNGSALLAPIFRQPRALRLLNLVCSGILCVSAVRLYQT